MTSDTPKELPQKDGAGKRKRRKKGFDTKHYNVIFKWVTENLKFCPQYYLQGVEKPCPIKHVQPYLSLISDCIEGEDYEAAQATKDAIIKFLNSIGAELPAEVLLNIPDFKPMDAHGIICLGRKDDPSGMGSGGAITF